MELSDSSPVLGARDLLLFTVSTAPYCFPPASITPWSPVWFLRACEFMVSAGANMLGNTLEAGVGTQRGQGVPGAQGPLTPRCQQFLTPGSGCGMEVWLMPASGPSWSCWVSYDDTPRLCLLFTGCVCILPHHVLPADLFSHKEPLHVWIRPYINEAGQKVVISSN